MGGRNQWLNTLGYPVCIAQVLAGLHCMWQVAWDGRWICWSLWWMDDGSTKIRILRQFKETSRSPLKGDEWVPEMSGFQSGTAALTGHWESQSYSTFPTCLAGCLALPPSDGCKDQQDSEAACEEKRESINNPSACDSYTLIPFVCKALHQFLHRVGQSHSLSNQ